MSAWAAGWRMIDCSALAVLRLCPGFHPVRTGMIRSRRVVLVGDVLITGATLEMAVRTLKQGGTGAH